MQPAPHLRPLSFRAKVKDTKQFPRHPPPFVTGSLIPAAGRYILHTRLCSFGHNSHAQEIGNGFTLAVRHQRKGSGEIINNFPPLTRLILATIKTVQGNVDFKKVQIQEIACDWKILQSGASSQAKIGGAYFSGVSGSIQDPIAVPGPCEVTEP